MPKEHRTHFETLRQEIIDFTKAHGIPKESLGSPDLLREATKKLSTQDLERLALLLERFEHLLTHKEPRREKSEALEYADEWYNLSERYAFQMNFLKTLGIYFLHERNKTFNERIANLKNLLGSLLPFGKKKREVPSASESMEDFFLLDVLGRKYSVPTLEQIAARLFERREELETKHDQGFTHLLFVPFAVETDLFMLAFGKFLQDRDMEKTLVSPVAYASTTRSVMSRLRYFPQSFDAKGGDRGKDKMDILKELSEQASSFLGWRILLLQTPHGQKRGFRGISKDGDQKKSFTRPELEVGKTPSEYLSLQRDETSPYDGESSMVLEDWICAFMIHYMETRSCLDDMESGGNAASYLTGVSLPGDFTGSQMVIAVKYAHQDIFFYCHSPHHKDEQIGARFVVEV
ncbi:TPA: hypothetical protein DDZ06_02200 [Candidatus Uhrbacteria bacterium]|nr:hypothetical protein [Candidatus Uhrbacteria bacterium]